VFSVVVKYLRSITRLSGLFTALLCAAFGAGNLSAETLAAGDPFPELKSMQDQHEKAYAVPEDVKHIAVAFTMKVGKNANQALAEKGADYLPESKGIFIANIYGMPAIGRFFAIPKMQKYPHRIMLADAERLLDDFPQKEDRVTVFDLDPSGTILQVRYWNPKSGKDPF